MDDEIIPDSCEYKSNIYFRTKQFMSEFDLYEDIAVLSNRLQRSGFEQYGSELLAALTVESTGTEVYMMLRWNLMKIIENKNLPADICTQSQFLHELIDKKLRIT